MMVGEIVGPFEILKELGSGAMGTVYKARHTNGQIVAIKVVALGLVGNEAALKRFDREVAILKQLKHPNIVRCMGTGRYRKTPFYVMEYVEGESLDHVQARRDRFTWEEVVVIGKQLCEALAHAHDKGIVHRDLKPPNLMVMADGTIKLTDFGIAKTLDVDVTALTGANSTIGTAAYMSPEQCRGEKTLGPKSDIYSFGIVLYELLTGKKPFVAESAVDMFMMHVNGKFERPSRLVMDVPVWLDNLVCQMMEKKPEHRPIDAAMVGRVLAEIEEKVNTQKSVGVDVASARVIDRPRMNNPADASDREAVKNLRTGKKKKKKVERPKTLFEKKWVQAIALITMMIGLGFVAFMLTRPERPEKLIADIDKFVGANQKDAAISAIDNYLAIYGERTDPETERMRQLDRGFEVAKRESQLFNRYRKKMGPEEDDDPTAYEASIFALDAEADGDLANAKLNWKKLIDKFASDTKPAAKMWADLGKRKSAAIDDIDRREQRMNKRISDDAIDEKERTWDDEAERISVEALRFESFGDPGRAKERWTKVKDLSTGDIDKRHWFLLAGKKERQLKETLKGKMPDEEAKERIANIENELKRVPGLREESNPARHRDARNICRTVRDLYKNDPDTKIAPLVQQAETLLKQSK